MSAVLVVKIGVPCASPLLERMRHRMEHADWRRRLRAAKPSEDPATWDWDELDRLDSEFNLLKLVNE